MLRMVVVVATCLAAVLVPATASADNTSSTGAYSIVPGGPASEAFLSDAAGERWYIFTATAGRSYCAETQGGVSFDTSATAGRIDTVMEVYRQDATTLISSNDDMATEPRGFVLSRVCWIPTANETNYVMVRRFGPSGAFNIRARVVETTLFSPWFFVGGDYNAFTVLRNTTGSTISFTVNWRNAAGTIVHTLSSTLPANGGTFYGARSFAGVLAAVNGTIDIAFTGSPQALIANTTVMSATTGLSFDAGFSQRASW
jgi:hypothetical protein